LEPRGGPANGMMAGLYACVLCESKDISRVSVSLNLEREIAILCGAS
jgi:hypothetical protein